MKSWIPVFIASFAAISADSLPSIPTWSGIHSMEMLNLTVEARFSKDNILSTLSGLDLDFPFCSACIALRESVKITEFWMPPLRIHACSIAISSVVKTDRIGFSLILDVWPSSGTTKALPTVSSWTSSSHFHCCYFSGPTYLLIQGKGIHIPGPTYPYNMVFGCHARSCVLL